MIKEQSIRLRKSQLLEKCGNELRLPHSKALGNGLFELRERAYGYRIYYTFTHNHTIFLLQGGDKKTQHQDIKIERERLDKIDLK
ncbi:MAG TPA: type II toxin-antitoxin system RelE/ParE family toxin [Alphaproteobacteria bacterium]|nr:type II toxin-antitoxin system RelE/ParE family toxin [Alphaproteobacteria bacterium]HQS93584.1 type II toxin-antitoxin system RelE/ParE family toxin [Alphaproteobacteria bacterium]